MSGGIAYVLDLDPARCNLQLVGLEGLEADDEQTVRELLGEHVDRTGSPVARRLLEEWEPSRFVKVMPHDYKAALAPTVSAGGIGFLGTETEEAA
jgi:glutamate synthase (NADPH/NADH) large chain